MVYEIEYSGKWLSINAAYGSNRWNRTRTKNEFKKLFKPLIKSLGIVHPLREYRLEVRYWSRLDSLNVTAGVKIFEDCCTELGVIVNDDKRYQKGFSVTPDSTLKHNTYIITIITHQES